MIFCRYHLAVLPPRRPRFFAVNSGFTEDGNEDFSAWFRREGVPILADLVNGDIRAIRRRSADERAILRRTIVFPIRGMLIRGEALQTGRDALDAQVQAMVQRERTLYPHLVRP